MDVITRPVIQRLATHRAERCVSVYMPTHRAGREKAQDPIRLKNLLNSAESDLLATGMRASEARNLLQPARELVSDGRFWSTQDLGLAIFLADGVFDVHQLADPVDELATVEPRFHVTPLFSTLRRDHSFFILAMSQSRVRLLSATAAGAHEVTLPNDPGSLPEALWSRDPERQLQSHRVGRTGQGRVVASFHGHGMGFESQKDEIARYFRIVDQALHELLATQDAPLLLAGVDYELALFRSVTSYRHVVDDQLTGNPDALSERKLHERAWELMAPIFDRERREATDRFEALLASGLASNDPIEIIAAAEAGRVDTVFVPLDNHSWMTGNGTETHDGEPQPGNEDLFDRAAVITWTKSGRVFAVPSSEVPGTGSLAALFRY